ncbi:hypothetical protein A2U01_0065536, partial [Trifolium medium]|nr:hypothetical protein [Trifolium medium]
RLSSSKRDTARQRPRVSGFKRGVARAGEDKARVLAKRRIPR